MDANDTITLFHAPQSRSSGALTLLEELRAPYALHILNLKAGEQRQAPYLAVNPLGKVPAIRHRGALITEQVAIAIYLSDLFPAARLAPALDDPRRGPYLRWLVYYAACYEPALVDRALKREPAPLSMSPYGAFDAMFEAIVAQLSGSPYLLGQEITAADILWGNALRWGSMFKLLPENAVVAAYVNRVTSRPSFAEAAAIDARLVSERDAAGAAQ
jgi:glutathione S-transferase